MRGTAQLTEALTALPTCSGAGVKLNASPSHKHGSTTENILELQLPARRVWTHHRMNEQTLRVVVAAAAVAAAAVQAELCRATGQPREELGWNYSTSPHGRGHIH